MKKLRNWIHLLPTFAVIVMITIAALPSHGQTSPTPSSSAASSPSSAIPVSDDKLIKACAEAVEELKAARKLLESQGKQIAVQAEMITLEREISNGLKQINTLNAAEKTALRDAITAKDLLIKQYKSQRATFWTKAKWLIVGGAVGVIVGTVLANE